MVAKRTRISLSTILILLMQHHLINLPRHSLDMINNQLVKIRIRPPATNLQRLAHSELVVLVELQHVNVLVHAVRDLPRDGEVVEALGGRTDDDVAAGLRAEVLFRLRGVEGAEEGVLDDALGAARDVVLLLHVVLVLGFLVVVPFFV